MDFKRTEDIIISIFNKSTFKRTGLADSLDTATIRSSYGKYRNAMREDDLIEYHNLVSTDFANTDLSINYEAQILCIQTQKLVYTYLNDAQCSIVLKNIRDRITSQYVEKNQYYRIICGLPDLQDNTPIYVSTENSDICDTTKPIHTMTDTELQALYGRGVLQELAAKYPLLMYIPYLHRRADIISAREAEDFEPIVRGSVDGEESIVDKFFEFYTKNRNVFLQRHINPFYQKSTDYYESLMAMMLIWATRIDVIRDVHANIELDYYDDYDLAYIFQDYSLNIDSSISKDIRADIAKNINLLVRNRGTNEVLRNLADIFNIKNIYNYVIQKLYVNGEPVLRCHAVPVNDMKNMAKYLTREYGYITYGKLVENDDTWADKQVSSKTTAEIEAASSDEYKSTYERLLNTDFSYIHSKYVSVDNIINMSQMSMDFSLFFNYMLQTTQVHHLTVHHRLSNTSLTLLQVYAYLCSLLSMKYKFKDNIAANASELVYILGLNDSYQTTGSYMKWVTETNTIIEYVDKEVITYPEVPGDGIPDTTIITLPASVTVLVAGYQTTEVVNTSSEIAVVGSRVVTTYSALGATTAVGGYQTTEVYNNTETGTQLITEADVTSYVGIVATSLLGGYQSSEVYNQTTIATSITTYSALGATVLAGGYQTTEVYNNTTTETLSNVPESSNGGNTSGEPIITIIKVPVEKQVTTSSWKHFTLSEVEVSDLLRIFEGHFSGTDYMYILQNWIVMNPNASFEDFIDTFCNDRKLIYTLREILRETYDIGQYHIVQTVLHYMTRMKAKTSVYGNITTYSEYLKDTAPTLYSYYTDMMTDLSDANWSQTFTDEIVYTLNLITSLIEELNNDFYTDCFSFIEDLRDTQMNEMKNVLAYLVDYFTSMTVTVKDSSFKYELGDEEDSLLAKEGMFKTRSDRKLNNFDGIDEQLILKRKKSISDSFIIKEYLAIKYNKLKEKKIGG
jgi:hypothetical protein